MKKILPIVFALLILTGTSGMQNSSFAEPENNSQGIIHAPDRLIVKFNPGVSENTQSSILNSQAASVLDDLPLLGIKIISVPEPALEAVKNALSKNHSVEYAEYDLGVPPAAIPNDPRYGNQWHLPKINAPGAYDVTYGDGFPIVILDSGIDMDHSDLASQIVHPYNGLTQVAGPVDHQNGCGHGTPVAGSAAAITNNNNGIAGVGWDMEIIPVKITDDSATGDTKCYGWSNGVLKGVEWGVSHGAKVVNLSYGFGASGHILTAAQLLQDNGGWLVISAGNDYQQINKADDPRVIFVSSTTSSDVLSGFSSYGDYVDISAPGSGIQTTTDGGGYNNWSGTSFAAPITAGALNLLYSVDPTLTSTEAYDILKDNAVDLGDPGWDIRYGHGRVDAHAAVLAASNSESLVPEVPPVNFKVAFIGDQGLNTNSEAVLQMIANEGTDMVLHSGDLDYAQNPAAWENQVNLYLGATFPYFVSVGNHDIEVAGQWADYQNRLQIRLDSIPDATCVGDLGVKASCHFKGLFFILSGVGTLSTYSENEYVSHIQTELANDDSIWSICSWHKNQQAMQIGGKGNEVGWPAYEACKDGGAIIATAHEHSYERTKTLTSTQAQTVDPTWDESNDVRVAPGSTFAFVSGLGGQSIRDQERCDPSDVPYGCNGEWANIYAQEQGANHGALFCDFNVDGQEDRAYCYFKNISGNVVDSFYVTSFMGTPNTTTPSNTAPVANSQPESTDENVPIIIQLDSTDSDGDLLAYSIETTPVNGGLSGTGPYLIYTPDPNFDGVDSFTFKTNDGNADSNTATVTITVVGDPPGTVNSRISASSDDAEQRISDNAIDLTSSDIEIGNDPSHNLDQIEGLRFNNLDIPQGATIDVAYIEFETDETDSEATSVTIRAQDSDNTATFTSTPSNISDRPTTSASVAWNNIPSWNTVSEKHQTPDLSTLVQEVVDRNGWNSGNSMAFIIEGTGQRTAESWDGESENAALLHVEWSITPVNNPPVADNQSVSTDENTPLDITLTANDTDGDPLTYTMLSNTTNGSLSGAAPNLTYTPNTDFTGNDSFTFNANDGADDSNTATISITVDPVNNPPIAGIGSYSTAEDTLLQVPVPGVLGNATDFDGDPMTAVLDTDVSNGSLTLNTDGSFSYTPDADFNGADSFTYHANDGIDDSNTNTIFITVDPVNDAPTADAGGAYIVILPNSVDFDGSGSFDIDGDLITYFWDFGDGTNSTDANPTHNYASGGTFPVTLVVNDGNLDSPVSNASVEVLVPNDPPTADAGIDQNVDENTLVSLSGGGTDTDGTVDGYAWTQTAGTTVTLFDNTAQSPTFTAPEVGPGGETLTFSLIVTDNGGADSTADTVDINVADVPVPVTEIHVGDLDVSKTGKKNWHARVVVTVHDDNDSVVSNISVTGDWSGAETSSSNCVTDEFGQCEVSESTRGEMLTFTVTGLAGSNHNYDDEANHDSDGDSDGNTITIFKDGTVPGINVAPEFTSDPINGQSVTDGQQYSGTLDDDATDSNGDALTFSKQSGPAWLNVAADGTLSGTATAVGLLPETQDFVVEVSDPFGLTDTATLQIEITEPLPQEDIHVGSISGTSEPGKGPRWTATIDIQVHDSGHQSVSGITVSGTWSDDANGSGSCVTDGTGICSVSKTIKGGSQATFTVTDLTGTNVNYAPGDNDGGNSFSAPRP